MFKVSIHQLKVELKCGKKNQSSPGRSPAGIWQSVHSLILFLYFSRVLSASPIFSFSIRYLSFPYFRPSTWENTSRYCSPDSVWSGQTETNWKSRKGLPARLPNQDEYMERGGKWNSRRSGLGGSPWSTFHLVNNFLIIHEPILKLDVLFLLFLPGVHFRHFGCWNMPLWP